MFSVIHNESDSVKFIIEFSLENLPSLFSSLLRATYYCTELFYVEHNGKPYYNCSNIWSRHEVSELPEHVRNSHDDCYCDCDCDCEDDDDNPCPIKNKTKIQKGSETYFFRFDNNEIERMNIQKNHAELIRSIFRCLNSKPASDIIITTNYDITLLNRNGINHDHRGSDHTIIELPVYKSVNLGKIFTLNDFMTAAYKIKSHKFDTYHELFCGISGMLYNPENKDLTIIAFFDHGS